MRGRIPRKSFNKFFMASREDGSMSVEFVILFPLVALIIVAIVEFGHLWFVRHALTNASREGARAAVVFYVGGGRNAWAEATAKAVVDKYLQDTKLPGTWQVNTTAGSNPGDLVTVTVTTPNGLVLLHKVIPAFDGISISGQTTMRME